MNFESGFLLEHFFFQEHVGVDPLNVHLIGHSLGAHTVGYAGERIKGLGRITGNYQQYATNDPTAVY